MRGRAGAGLRFERRRSGAAGIRGCRELPPFPPGIDGSGFRRGASAVFGKGRRPSRFGIRPHEARRRTGRCRDPRGARVHRPPLPRLRAAGERPIATELHRTDDRARFSPRTGDPFRRRVPDSGLCGGCRFGSRSPSGPSVASGRRPRRRSRSMLPPRDGNEGARRVRNFVGARFQVVANRRRREGPAAAGRLARFFDCASPRSRLAGPRFEGSRR